MKVDGFGFVFILAFVGGCGPARPNPSDFKSSSSAATSDSKTGSGKDNTTNKTGTQTPTPTKADTPKSTTPPPAGPSKLAIRSAASPDEITAAKAEYEADCGGCHQPLATSAKKGRPLAAINSAGVAGTIVAHNALVDGNKWPKDVADATDDGVDTAVLKASAMAEALK